MDKPRNKTEAVVLLQKRNKWDIFVILRLIWLIISQCNAYQQVQYQPSMLLINHEMLKVSVDVFNLY